MHVPAVRRSSTRTSQRISSRSTGARLRTSAGVVLLLGLCLGGCDQAALSRARQERDAARAQATEASTAVGRLRVERDAVREAAAQTVAAAEKDLAAAQAAVAAADKQIGTLEARIEELVGERAAAAADGAESDAEQLTLELKDVKHHRDELLAWIAEDLLPIAEKQDPRLVELREQTEKLSREVERIRGLKFKRPVASRLIPRAQLGDWMRAMMEEDSTPEEVEAMSAVGAKFGLLEPGTDLAEVAASMLEAGVAGLYKPNTRTFYLIEGSTGVANNPVVFHELVHALDDQYFDLTGMQRRIGMKGTGDRMQSYMCMVEGCADLFQDVYHSEHPDEFAAMNREQMTPENLQRMQRSLTEVPAFLIATTMFRYKGGSAFLRAQGADSAEKIARFFEFPPVSTEQVLHPEKYDGGAAPDFPHTVALDGLGAVLGEGWEEIDANEFGELMTGFLLAHLGIPDPRMRMINLIDQSTGGIALNHPIDKAVAGWDGDRYVAWRNADTKDVCIVWTSVWDSEDEASEFVRYYGRYLSRHVTGKQIKEPTLPLRLDERGGGVTSVTQQGARVVVVLGAPTDKVDALIGIGEAAQITADPRDPADSGR